MGEWHRAGGGAVRLNGRGRLVATGLPAGAVSSTTSVELRDGWQLCRTSPGAHETPSELAESLSWSPAVVPGTVAAAVGPPDLDAHPEYDASDWWYRCAFAHPGPGDGDRVRMRFDGLATLAEVWLNGEPVFTSSNMFCAYEADVTDLVSDRNELTVAFRSLGLALSQRRPRPRWKTRLVDEQQLRWFRTTLLGRIPGWTPAIQPVGPWRPVHLETVRTIDLRTLDLRTSVDAEDGVVELVAELHTLREGASVERAALRCGESELPARVTRAGNGWSVRVSARVERPALWWPRTHGVPALHPSTLELSTSDGPVSVDLGGIGFRDVRVDRTDGRIRFVVNGVPVFCRGACWTTNDVVSLGGPREEARRTLKLLAGANGNMVRIGGTMVYETDDFYRACDELGVMVWQDFMFANMDYPVDDEDFATSVRVEASHQLGRLARHPALVAYCGGSEVEQQAAMFGAPRDVWTNDFFSRDLADLVESSAPGAPYWRSSPTGGALPFFVGEGIAHYYGVGAYKRPLEDARLAGVRFTPECLGFSHVPEPANLRNLTAAGPVAPHHPAWKRGVPRDSGAGWDFEDVRDHYLEHIYGVDAVELRAHDPEAYQRLARVVTGQVMARVFDEWRSAQSTCGGGLVWFLKDLRPGAGWGIVDSENRPKPVYHYLRRAWAPVRITVLDRGLDGLRVELHNETDCPIGAVLEVRLLDAASVTTGIAATEVGIPARGTTSMVVEELIDHFADPTYSYRFGPLRHAATAVILRRSGADDLIEVFWPRMDMHLPETRLDVPDGAEVLSKAALTVRSEGLARAVRIEAEGWDVADNYFDLLPGDARRVGLAAKGDAPATLRGYVDGANVPSGVAVRADP